MAEPLYKYNPATLSYEKAKVRWDRVLFKGLSFIALTSLCFLILFRIQGAFFTSDKQRRLTVENRAFEETHATMVGELASLRGQIDELRNSESEIYRRLYLSDKQSDEGQRSRLLDKNDLDFSTTEFTRIYERTIELVQRVSYEASGSNYTYSTLFWPAKSDVEELQQYPTLSPIKTLNAEMIACGYGYQTNPFNKKIYRHLGLDILAETGTEVLASGNGRVKEVHHDSSPGGSGTYIVIDHGKGFQTRYSKLGSTSLRLGQFVRQGQVIGLVGQTGSSFAPHLHYEVLVSGKHVDPVTFFIENMGTSELEAIKRRASEQRQSLD
ncbi:MAG: M23 family metallopeptidase [Cyclobacteriaceae bacterium]